SSDLTYPGGSSESWTYDEPRGLLHLYTNRNTKTKTFTYDALSRMKTASWNDNGTTPMVTYTYDPKGRTLTINNVNANITLDYYNDDLLNTQTVRYGDSIDRVVTYTYDDDSRLATLGYPASAYTFSYGYTARSQIN